MAGETAATTPVTSHTEVDEMVKSLGKMKTDDNNNTPNNTPSILGKNHSNMSNSSQYHGNRGYKRRPFNSGNNRGYHNGNTYGGNRNGGYHNSRHNGGGNYHSSDYGRYNHESGYKSSTTPTSLVSQQSSTIPDSSTVAESQSGTSDYQQQTTADYSNAMAQQQQAYQYVYQQEYDPQASYCVQAPMPYYCTYSIFKSF